MKKKINSNKPIKKLLYLIDNKFKFEIIYLLTKKSEMRFGEIKIEQEIITQQLLTKILKELERDGIINRKKYSGFPRKVEYSLTSFGSSFKTIINVMIRWEEKNKREINKQFKKKKLDSIYDYY